VLASILMTGLADSLSETRVRAIRRTADGCGGGELSWRMWVKTRERKIEGRCGARVRELGHRRAHVGVGAYS
jgi:hypothetical protein